MAGLCEGGNEPPGSLKAINFHLFRYLFNNLQGNPFDNKDALQTWLDDFFNFKPADFFRRGIEKLLH
ncbi:hypothetical protein ANN_22180 [Periplaneta americana]|uniref:Uncharacterized protein n=1 Tax=Periplaneta americana TaxID=6978 RepID=A0ABQ8S7V1_PERAM|nr:hypothetical protein ANN_22180 [Periplaneta americana]